MNAKTRAFLEGINSGKFNSDRAKIYIIIRSSPITLEDLKLHGFPEKTSSARTSELLDMGLIKSIDKK